MLSYESLEKGKLKEKLLIPIEKSCSRPECALLFVATNNRQAYCSPRCGELKRRPLKGETLPAGQCANLECSATVKQDRYHPGRVRFCSVKCRRREKVLTGKSKVSGEKWKREHPSEYEDAMARRKNKMKAHPELQEKVALQQRKSHYKKKYGITLEQKEQRIVVQNRRCANPGCQTETPGKKGFATDHSHVTGKLRGELCNRCNVALGMVNDSAAVLDGLVRYLKFYE